MSTAEPFSAARLPRLVVSNPDGTLVDSAPDLTVAVDSILTSLGRPPASIEKVRQWIDNGARVLARRAPTGSIEYGGIGEEEVRAALILLMEAYTDSHAPTEVYPSVVDTFKWLKRNDMEIALITNKPERFVAPLLGEMKLGHYPCWIIGSDTLLQQKSDPAVLLFVTKIAGIESEDALFIGDSRNDILAVRAAGMRCVALTYGYNRSWPIAEEMPTLVIDNLCDLLPCVDQAVEIVSPDDSLSSSGQQNQAVTVGKLWMRVIGALVRRCWHA